MSNDWQPVKKPRAEFSPAPRPRRRETPQAEHLLYTIGEVADFDISGPLYPPRDVLIRGGYISAESGNDPAEFDIKVGGTVMLTVVLAGGDTYTDLLLNRARIEWRKGQALRIDCTDPGDRSGECVVALEVE